MFVEPVEETSGDADAAVSRQTDTVPGQASGVRS
jgi:hypothetical protein